MKNRIFTGFAVATLAVVAGSTALAQSSTYAPITKPPITDIGNLPIAAPDSGATILLLALAAGTMWFARRRVAARVS